MKKQNSDIPKDNNSKGEQNIVCKNIKLTKNRINIKEGKFKNILFLDMGRIRNNIIGFGEEKKQLKGLQKEMEELKKEKEKIIKKKNELLLQEEEKLKKEINEAKIKQIFAEEFRNVKSIIIEELKEMLKEEHEYIKGELNGINIRLKKCEEEIKQIKDKLNVHEKNKESDNLQKNDTEKNEK